MTERHIWRIIIPLRKNYYLNRKAQRQAGDGQAHPTIMPKPDPCVRAHGGLTHGDGRMRGFQRDRAGW